MHWMTSSKCRTPCREFQGPTNSAGYGYPYIDGVRVLLHRWVVEQVDGPLAPGEVVRHRCDNPPCFRYSHLLRGTMKDNSQDMVRRGRHWSSRKVRCKRNHDDWVLTPDGRRRCRSCERGRDRTKRNARKRAQRALGR